MSNETPHPEPVNNEAPTPQPTPQAPKPKPEPEPTRNPKSEADAPLMQVGKRIIAHPVGKLMAVTFGVVFGLAIESGVDATGILGPGVDQLIAQQSEGFQNLEAKLEALRNTTDPAQATKLTAELETLLQRQQQLGQRTEVELRTARAEIEKLRSEVLQTKGATTGADLWLKPGESITVAGKPGNNFGFTNFTYSGVTSEITANVSGKPLRMKIGDAADFPADKGTWQVIYKNTELRSDNRVGFDLIFVPQE